MRASSVIAVVLWIGCSSAASVEPEPNPRPAVEPAEPQAEPEPEVEPEPAEPQAEPEPEVEREVEETLEPTAPPRPGVTGGWSDGDASSPTVRRLAEFAVRERSQATGENIQLVRIEWVKQQVVAGMNYRIGMNITRNGAAEQVTAVVYERPWRDERRLTAWAPGLIP